MAATTTNYEKCVAALTSMKDEYPTLVDDFIDWYEDGGWDNDGLNDEFLEDAEESSFIDWIKENKSKTNPQALQIFGVLHNAIKLIKPSTSTSMESGSGSDEHKTNNNNKSDENTLDPNKSFVVKLLNTHLEAKEKKKHIESWKSPTKKRIAVQSASMLPASSQTNLFKKKSKNKNQAQDILMCELLGYKNNNYPVLLHFVDSYMRCQLNHWITYGKQPHMKFSSSDFFSKHCLNAHFQQYLANNKGKHTIDFVRTAIDSYQKRVLPTFTFMAPTYKINANPLDIANYFFEVARIARNCANQPIHNFTHIIPMQIDFMILNTKIKDMRPKAENCAGVAELFSDTDDTDWDEEDDTDVKNSDDSDDDYDPDEKVSKNLEKLFKEKKILFYLYKNPLREMLRCTEDIKRIVDNKRSQRTVFILDRRQNKNKLDVQAAGTDGDKLYLFKPKKFDKFEDNYQELIHASLHHNSVKSILPRTNKKSKKGDFSVRESLRGQMFVISYHIISKEEIRCYLFYQGQCFRFYGEDLINVLPLYFVEEKKARQILLTKYNHDHKWRKAWNEFANTFVDLRFDAFYHGLTAKKPRIHVVQ